MEERRGRGRGWLCAAVASAAACAALLIAPAQASAQDAEPNQVTPTAKGIVGGALLGAEVVMIPMGAAGLKPWWPYVVFGAVGAAGGAVGGWAIEQNVEPAEPALYMLAGGLALIIPTVVLTLNATTRDEFEESTDPSTLTTTPGDDTAPAGGTPGAAPPGGQPTESTTTVQPTSDARRKVRKPRQAPPPQTLFDLAWSEVRIGVPAIQVRNMYSQEEMAKFGVDQETEVRIPVVGVTF